VTFLKDPTNQQTQIIYPFFKVSTCWKNKSKYIVNFRVSACKVPDCPNEVFQSCENSVGNAWLRPSGVFIASSYLILPRKLWASWYCPIVQMGYWSIERLNILLILWQGGRRTKIKLMSETLNPIPFLQIRLEKNYFPASWEDQLVLYLRSGRLIPPTRKSTHFLYKVLGFVLIPFVFLKILVTSVGEKY
jgi:hypothetical protein